MNSSFPSSGLQTTFVLHARKVAPIAMSAAALVLAGMGKLRFFGQWPEIHQAKHPQKNMRYAAQSVCLTPLVSPKHPTIRGRRRARHRQAV